MKEAKNSVQPGYLQLESWVNNFRLRQVTSQEYKEYLDGLCADIGATLEELSDFEIDEEIKKDFSEEINLGTLGLETILTAIRHLQEGSGAEVLDEGLKMAQRGYQMVDKAMEINKRSYEAMAESLEDVIRELEKNTLAD